MPPPSPLTSSSLKSLLVLPPALRTLVLSPQLLPQQHLPTSQRISQRTPTRSSNSVRCLHTTPRPLQQDPSNPTSASINPTEISHFSSLASSWWDPHGPSRLLHLMNPLRHRFITSCLTSQSDYHDPSTPLSYLDIGCGGGIFAESAARLPGTKSVTAIDPSRECIAVAKEHGRRDPLLLRREEEGRLTWLCMGVEDLHTQDVGRNATVGNTVAGATTQSEVHTSKEEGGQYDIVMLFEVLEHVNDPSAFLAQATKHVKPGGWLVLSTIARTWSSFITTKLFAEDILRIVPRGTHEWGKYLHVGEVEGWFSGQIRRGEAAGEGRQWEGMRAMGVIYVPGVGWREVKGGEEWGNYFFGVRRAVDG